MPVQTCIVSFVDNSGVRHSAEVSAETLFEAAALGLGAISQEWAEQPGPTTRVHVQVKRPAVSHEVTVRRLRTWLASASSSPREKLRKDRLRALLEA